MRKLFGGIACVVLALALAAGPATAQMHGNPTYPAIYGTGFTLLADYGRGVNDEAYKSNYFGGRAALGLPVVSLWAGAGSVKPEGEGAESDIVFGGGAALNIVQGPLVPVLVALSAGVGYLSEEGFGNTITVPAGVVLAINVPSPTVDVKPWIMPRVELMSMSFESDLLDSQSEVGFGVSGGLVVTLPTGFGFHVTGDFRSINDSEPVYLGGGVHYKIPIPSLGPPMM
jgi:hypothetical protein